MGHCNEAASKALCSLSLPLTLTLTLLSGQEPSSVNKRITRLAWVLGGPQQDSIHHPGIHGPPLHAAFAFFAFFALAAFVFDAFDAEEAFVVDLALAGEAVPCRALAKISCTRMAIV